MTVFVYEDVTASGAGGDGGSPPAPSLRAEARAMRDAVAADFAAVPGVRVVAVGQWTHVIDETNGTEFRELAASADYTLVIAPETGGRLEHLCREVLRVGGRLLVPSPDAVHSCADKMALARHLGRHNVATPATWELDDEPAGMPIVVKPRDGAGSRAMALLWRPHSDPARAAAQDRSPVPTDCSSMIAQEFVRGVAASVAFLIGPSQSLPLIPCEQLLTTDGRFSYLGGRLPIAPNLAARAVAIATAAIRCVRGLLGYVGVDVVLGDDGRDWAIEINPRLTTSYVGLRVLAQFNLAETMMAIVQGQSRELTWHDRRIEFTPDGRVFDVAPTQSGVAST